MSKIFKITDKINFGKGKKIAVSEIVEKKGEIFKLIKEGYEFDDEVLEKAHIKKTIRDVKTITEFVTNKKIDNKSYPKETENIKTILKSINTLEEVSKDDTPSEEEQSANDEFIEIIEE